MNYNNAIMKPVGLQEAIAFIDEACRDAAMYRCCGTKPPHLMLGMDPGEGRSTLVAYLVERYKAAGVLPFTCGLDDYLEIVLDGTQQQLRRAFAGVDACAVYANEYENVVAIDVIAMAAHLNENQCAEFLERCGRLCEHACVVFFTSAQRGRNEERLAQKVMESIPAVRQISVQPYTPEELGEMMKMRIAAQNILVEDEEQLREALLPVACSLETPTVRAAMAQVGAMMRYVDFQHVPARLTCDSISMIQDAWMKKGA